MSVRMTNPGSLIPEARNGLIAFSKTALDAGLTPNLVEILHLRSSQINSCGRCVDLHAKHARELGESEERLHAVAVWREAPYFTEAERAALALAECVTRLSDQTDPVPDAVWNEAARYYSEAQLMALIVSVAAINVWNRLNVSTRQEFTTSHPGKR